MPYLITVVVRTVVIIQRIVNILIQAIGTSTTIQGKITQNSVFHYAVNITYTLDRHSNSGCVERGPVYTGSEITPWG